MTSDNEKKISALRYLLRFIKETMVLIARAFWSLIKFLVPRYVKSKIRKRRKDKVESDRTKAANLKGYGKR